MKKALYYAAPFIFFPIGFGVLTWLDSIEIATSGIIMIAACALLLCTSALLGSLSPSERTFDFGMTLTVPLSFFCTLFVALFFDAGCDGAPQLSLDHALNMEYYVAWLPMVILMTTITFLASLRPIRIRKQ